MLVSEMDAFELIGLVMLGVILIRLVELFYKSFINDIDTWQRKFVFWGALFMMTVPFYYGGLRTLNPDLPSF